MHDVLRTRLLRKLESLPEEQVYQVLDYIEFLETKYSADIPAEASGLQSFAEKLEDQLRRRTVSPSSLREAFQLISAADKVLSNVSKVGKELLGELNGAPEKKEEKSEDPGG
jgi:predicted RND superfamily exporter protein